LWYNGKESKKEEGKEKEKVEQLLIANL